MLLRHLRLGQILLIDHEDYSSDYLFFSNFSFCKKLILNYIKNDILITHIRVTNIKFLINSINNREKICILGDYDVDGSSSTALFVRFLNEVKHPHFFYIPDREKDGYGATVKIFEKLLKSKPKLVVMLDCGSSANIAINFLNKNKIKSIIIDHHEIAKPFPKAFPNIHKSGFTLCFK